MASRQRRTVTPRSRDRFQILTAGVTSAAAFGALAATGLVAGQLANAHQEEQADKADGATGSGSVVVEKRRPHRTVVKTTVVDRVSSGASSSPGQGGTVTSRSTSSAQTKSGASSSGGSGASSQSSAPAKPAPARPAPAKPAPSSGS